MAETTKNVKQIDFDRDDIKGGYQERPEMYRGKRGRTDRIRVLTPPVSFYGARVEVANGGFFCISRADHDLIESGDFKAASKQCPLFEQGYEDRIKQRLCVLVHWISSTDGKGRKKRVDQILPWTFDPQKYRALKTIADNLPPGKDGKSRGLHVYELAVSCEDDNFQKLNFTAITSASMLECKFSESWDLAKEYFDDPEDRRSRCSLVDESTAPESKPDILAALKRASAVAGDEFDEDEEDKPRQKKSGKKPRPDEDEEEADPDVEDIDEEEDEPRKAPGRKPGSGKKTRSEPVDDDADSEAFEKPKGRKPGPKPKEKPKDGKDRPKNNVTFDDDDLVDDVEAELDAD